MSSLFSKTKDRLAQLKADPKRSLGQNFLVNEDVVRKIVTSVVDLTPAMVVEVGPGLGALTDELIHADLKPLVVELDGEFAKYWRESGLTVVEGDALKIDWSQLELQDPTVLVSNLPYQISTHIIVERTFGPREIRAMVLMFQKEVAERLRAKPSTADYGALSILMQSHWRITKVVDAGPKSFHPAPNVASQVLKFERLASPVAGFEQDFFSLLKVAFAQRRKLLAKNLLALGGTKAERVAEALTALGIGSKARAEELSVEQFVKLFGLLKS